MRMYYEYKGEKYLLKELAEIAGCSRQEMSYRLFNSKTVEEAIHYGKIKINGNYYSRIELAQMAGVSYSTMQKRVSKYFFNKNLEKLLSPKRKKEVWIATERQLTALRK